ncbi:MAG: hypothetical protein D6758_13215 [Gammaproteobacteria bacterium]|nr:MAG: hypothetical protein D6758_13215 [Gammaproteobacteria bacterium]
MNIQASSLQFSTQYRYDARLTQSGGEAQVRERFSASVRYSRTALEGGDGGMRMLAEKLHVRMSEKLDRPLPAPAAPFDGQAIQDRVLGFVGQRVEQARAEGAEDAEVNGLLDQAAEGVEKGFAEARDVLDAIQALNEELSAAIDETETGIQAGIEAMRPGQAGDDDASVGAPEADADAANPADEVIVPASSQPAASDSDAEAAGDNEEVTVPAALAFEGRFRGRYRASLENSLTVELRTREGDLVKLDLVSAMRAALKVRSEGGEGGSLDYRARFKSEGDFNFVVQGDLNAEELAAITDLFAQVAELADSFFNGDLGAAFDQALSLTADMSQLAEYSISMSQSARFRASERYLPAQGVQQLASLPAEASRMRETLAPFPEPLNLARDVMSRLFPELVPETEAARERAGNAEAFADYFGRLLGES